LQGLAFGLYEKAVLKASEQLSTQRYGCQREGEDAEYFTAQTGSGIIEHRSLSFDIPPKAEMSNSCCILLCCMAQSGEKKERPSPLWSLSHATTS